MTQPVEKNVNKAAEKSPRVRSPAYPSLSLPDAIDKAKIIYDKEAQGRHPAPITSIAKDWEYASVNGSVLTNVSALKQFGLLAEIPDKDPRELKLTADAMSIIVRADTDPKRAQAIKDCVLLPKLYQRLWTKYSWPLPSDATIKTYLELEEHYSSKFIDGIIKDYKSSILFAKLDKDDKIDLEIPAEMAGIDSVSETTDPKIKVGDYVLWDSQGVAQFAEAKRVRWVSDDDQWAAVDESQTGLPVAELQKVEPPKSKGVAMNAVGPLTTPPIPPQAPTSKPGVPMSQDTFTIGGSVALIRWPETLTAEQFADLQDWIELQLRKTARESGIPVPKKN